MVVQLVYLLCNWALCVRIFMLVCVCVCVYYVFARVRARACVYLCMPVCGLYMLLHVFVQHVPPIHADTGTQRLFLVFICYINFNYFIFIHVGPASTYHEFRDWRCVCCAVCVSVCACFCAWCIV